MSKNKAQIFHFDLYGKREDKYTFLGNNSMGSIAWNELQPKEPNYFFVQKDTRGQEEYEKGFKVDELFKQSSSGVETRKDSLTIDMDINTLKNAISDFQDLEISELAMKYNLDNDSRDWKIEWAKEDIKNNNPKILITQYKPFDYRYIIYTGKTKGINGYPMYANFKNFIEGANIGLCLMRKLVNTSEFKSVHVTSTLMDKNFYGFQTYAFPLYLYPDQSPNTILTSTERVPNLNMEIVQQIAGNLGLTFTPEKNTATSKAVSEPVELAPIDILDYIYAVLHSPTYREKYKEFLKIDFPRVPYPTGKEQFWQLVKLGGEIRQIHLLESPTVENFITQYPIDGDNVVGKPRFVSTPLNERGRVYINQTQYFDNVPLVAWEFYIGGYQPAQKWLKDRKDRKLEFEDILHYQKIIVALTETHRLMKEIDGVGVE